MKFISQDEAAIAFVPDISFLFLYFKQHEQVKQNTEFYHEKKKKNRFYSLLVTIINMFRPIVHKQVFLHTFVFGGDTLVKACS